MGAAALLWMPLLALPGGAGPGTASGQEVPSLPTDPADFASPLLSPDHWAVDALRRLQAMALLPAGFDPVASSITRREAALMLTVAATPREPDAGEPDAGRKLAAGYRARFAEEFPAAVKGVTEGADAVGWSGGSSVGGGFETRRDVLLARRRHPDRGAGTSLLPDLDEPLVDLDLSLQGGASLPPLAVRASLRRAGGGWRLGEAHAVLARGPVGIWGGRRIPGFRPGTGGGIVLDPGVAVDGAGLFLREGVRLPAFLRHLGAWRFETFLSRLDEAGGIEDPWFFGLRASLAPHRRVRIGVNRAALFGGSNHPVPETFGRVVRVLAGLDNADEGLPANFENHVGSLDVRVSPPLAWPVALYAEWGVEDVSLDHLDHLGLAVGGRLAAIPGAPGIGIGLEWTTFQAPGADHPRADWYHHRTFGTWTDGGRLLGHPLGGEGEEWRLYGSADLTEARVRLRWHAFLRDRGQDNLFAPERAGESRGLGGRLEGRIHPRVEVSGGAGLEDGEGWRETRGWILLRTFF